MVKIILEGNTYPIRQQLRSYGFTWDTADSRWVKPIAPEEEVRMFGEYVQKGIWPKVRILVEPSQM